MELFLLFSYLGTKKLILQNILHFYQRFQSQYLKQEMELSKQEMEGNYCHTRLHRGFSAKLRIWQVPTCKMEPQSGIIITLVMIRSPCATFYKPSPKWSRNRTYLVVMSCLSQILPLWTVIHQNYRIPFFENIIYFPIMGINDGSKIH